MFIQSRAHGAEPKHTLFKDTYTFVPLPPPQIHLKGLSTKKYNAPSLKATLL